MELKPADARSMYRILSGAVVPRPIAWVSTTDGETDNLAPYSFFNVVGIDPPVVMFAPASMKDTPRNVLETGEFVVNVVTADLAAEMNATSATLSSTESEFDHANIEREPSETVDAPRVAASPVAFECELYDYLEIGRSWMILGEITHVRLDDTVITDGELDVRKFDALGRLAGSFYTETSERFALERPE